MPNKSLSNALTNQKKLNEQVNPKIDGLLGIPIDGQSRVEVANRNGFVYVRLRNNQSEVIQAFNNQVAPAYNLPVLVERRGNRYSVVGVDTERYENNWSSVSSFLPRHGNTHSFNPDGGGGGDVVWVYPRQFMPMLAIPSGSAGGPNVVVASHILRNADGTWRYTGNTGTANITQYRPATGAIMALVYLDTVSGNPYFLVGSGTVFSSTITGSSAITSYIPQSTNPNYIPISAIRLVTGITKITWGSIYDVRQFLQVVPTGSAGGSANPPISGSVVVQDESVIQGSALALNFVGDGVSASISGTVARISIAGVSGSSSFVGTPSSVVLTNETGVLTTKPWLKWGTSYNEYMEFGADEVGKEVNAGRIGYRFSDGADYFDIIGAGSGVAGSPRRVRIREYLLVDEDMDVSRNFYAQFANIASGSNYNVGGTPHIHAPPTTGTFVVRDEGVTLGSATILNVVGNSDISLSGGIATLFTTGTALLNGQSVLGGAITLTGTAGTYQDTGLSVTLPNSGTYELTANVRANLRGGTTGTLWYLTAELYNATDAVAVANSERIIISINDNTLSLQTTCPISNIIQVASSKVINLFVFRNGSGGPTWNTSTINSDANGRTTLSYKKIA